MSCLNNIQRMTFQSDQLKNIIELYQYKGKDFYYQDVLNKDMNIITTEAVERDCYALVKILKLSITDNRLKLLIRKDSLPKTNEEKLIYNAKKVLMGFAFQIDGFEITANQFLRMAEQLFYGIKKISFDSYKINEPRNLLAMRQKSTKRDVLEKIISDFSRLLRTKDYEFVNLVTCLYVDCVESKIFTSDNEYIGLFIIIALLSKLEFGMFKYSSFFELYLKKLEKFKKGYYDASFRWSEGYSVTIDLANVITEILIEGYEQIDSKLRAHEIQKLNQKTFLIESSIMRLPQIFTKEMVMNKNPNTSMSTIDRTLKRMREENKIKPNGTGRNATWVRLVEEEMFDPEQKQTSMFDDIDI